MNKKLLVLISFCFSNVREIRFFTHLLLKILRNIFFKAIFLRKLLFCSVKSAPEDRKISEQSNVGEVANTKSNVVNALFNYMKGKRRNSIGGADNTDLDSVASCANAPQNVGASLNVFILSNSSLEHYRSVSCNLKCKNNF